MGFSEVQEHTAFALRGRNSLGAKGDIILGDEKLFNSEAIISSINLPNGNWQIAAIPVHGWKSVGSLNLSLHLLAFIVAFSFAVLVTWLSISRQLNHDLAFYDHLTNLPNRRLLEDRMLQVMAYSKRYDSSFGLFYLDLDDFKPINDTYGHKLGDVLLVEVSKRMLASVRATDTVARVGGDEFIILVNDIHHETDMANICQHLEEHLMTEACINGVYLQINVSIGFAVYPDDEHSLDKLKHRADKRMYEAKAKKKSLLNS